MSNLESLQKTSLIPADRCGMMRTAEILGDKWTLMILRELFYNVGKFEDIRAELGVPKSVLSARLTHLIQHGVVEKRPYQEKGTRARYAYHLTKSGKGLSLTFLAMSQWGNAHFDNDTASVEIVKKDTKDLLMVGLVDAKQPRIRIRDILLRLKQRR